MIFGFISAMFPHTGFTKVYVTNVTVLKGGRGLTEVTPYDILEAVHRVHDQASRFLLLEMLENKGKYRNEYMYI